MAFVGVSESGCLVRGALFGKKNYIIHSTYDLSSHYYFSGGREEEAAADKIARPALTGMKFEQGRRKSNNAE